MLIDDRENPPIVRSPTQSFRPVRRAERVTAMSNFILSAVTTAAFFVTIWGAALSTFA